MRKLDVIKFLLIGLLIATWINIAQIHHADGGRVDDAEYPCKDKADVVFIMDTSDSMDDEFSALCNQISNIIADFQSSINITYKIYGLGDMKECTNETIQGNKENWGPGIEYISKYYPWEPDATRIIIVLSDEGPYEGCCPINARDENSINAAITAAKNNNVRVFPILGSEANQCFKCNEVNKVQDLMQKLANNTGGKLYKSTDPATDIARSIKSAISYAICDKDGDGVIDFEDDCPDIPGSKANRGCPDTKNNSDNNNYACISTNKYTINANVYDKICDVTVTFSYSLDGREWKPIGTSTTVPHGVKSDLKIPLDFTSIPDQKSIQIKIVATNECGLNATDLKKITLDRTKPTLTLSLPEYISNDSYTIQVNANDNLEMDSVKFYYSDGMEWKVIGTSNTAPYAVTWDLTSVQDKRDIQIKAIAKDKCGNTAETIKKTTIDRTPPTVTVDLPEYVTKNSYTIQVRVYDNQEMDSVKFYYSDGMEWKPIGTSNSAPYAVTWNLTSVQDKRDIQIKAIAKDKSGNTAETIKTTTIDRTSPIVTIALPCITTNSYILKANVYDNLGMDSVTYSYSLNRGNDWKVIGTSNTAPYAVTWDLTSVQDKRDIQIKAIAKDKSGNTAEAINTTILDRTPPAVTLKLFEYEEEE